MIRGGSEHLFAGFRTAVHGFRHVASWFVIGCYAYILIAVVFQVLGRYVFYFKIGDATETAAFCQRRSKISPPGRSKTSPLNVMRYAVLGGCPGSP